MIALRSSAAASALLAMSIAASAAPKPAPACSFGDLAGVTVTGCSGFVRGNLVSGSSASQALAADMLGDLGLAGASGAWLEKVEDFSGATIVFDTPLYGLTYIGLHRGGAGDGGQGTAFYVFDAGQSGIFELGFSRGGLSNAAIYSTGSAPAVPEPGAAAMLLAGLGALGLLIHRRR